VAVSARTDGASVRFTAFPGAADGSNRRSIVRIMMLIVVSECACDGRSYPADGLSVVDCSTNEGEYCLSTSRITVIKRRLCLHLPIIYAILAYRWQQGVYFGRNGMGICET
jgi:hypothetical protein